jgi:hypothetical protein
MIDDDSKLRSNKISALEEEKEEEENFKMKPQH